MLEIRLLGPVAVLVDDVEVDPGPARQRCALAALAVDAGHVVPVDRLVRRVWGEAAGPRARATLMSYLSRLRRVLAPAGGEVLVRRPGGYAVDVEPAAVDAHRYRDLCARARAGEPRRAAALLEEALGLWRGQALSGLGGDWAEAERDRLGRDLQAAEDDLTDALLALGHGEDLVPRLAARVAERPLDERLAAQHLLALHRAGRTADALTHYRLLRGRLVEELGADPGPALRDLHRRILADDPALAGAPRTAPVTAPTTPPATAPVPRQLPAPPPAFVGRRAELDRLDAAVRDSPAATVVISAIAGAGGVGKTWLALHWAHRNADRFPDGQLFVDLRGFSPRGTPMDPAVAVRGFLDALDVPPDRVPADPHARAALYRSLTSDRRVLVVLDNAAGVEQVLPLLPGGNRCTAVVTSRDQLTGLIAGHGARHLPLDVLSDAEARALLAERLGAARVEAEPAAVDELIGFCGGFPLALGILAGRARTRPRLPLAVLVAELRDSGLDALDDGDPAASLPAVLSWSHRALDPDQATALALLGIAPGPDIGLPAAARLLGLPPDRARATLRALERVSLIGLDRRNRYHLHDLIRRYAAGAARDLPAPVREAALRRVVDHYLSTAHAGDRLLEPHRAAVPLDPPEPEGDPHPVPDAAAALAWFDAEHACLLAAQRTAGGRRWHREAWHLAWALDSFHTLRGHRGAGLDAWSAALAAAGHLDDPAPSIIAHRRLGALHANLEQHEEAIGHLDRALALAERHGDRTVRALVHQSFSWAWEQRGDHRRALEHATRAMEINRALGNPVWVAGSLNAMGWYAALLGEHDRAREHCLAALALIREQGNPGAEAATLDSLGYVDHRTGRHRRAVEQYLRALELFREIGDTYEEAGTLDRLGHPHLALGERERARAVWTEALRLFRAQGREADAAQVERQLADLAEADPGPR
ncbi:BTAD domain-containing putative transcriptional regulator [Actinosynnema sp. NPDC059797]